MAFGAVGVVFADGVSWDLGRSIVECVNVKLELVWFAVLNM